MNYTGFTQSLPPSATHSHTRLLLHDFNSSLLENSPITMLPNYNIQPTGDEHGNYLVVDLGGSTLRVAVVHIDCPDTSRGSSPEVNNYHQDSVDDSPVDGTSRPVATSADSRGSTSTSASPEPELLENKMFVDKLGLAVGTSIDSPDSSSDIGTKNTLASSSTDSLTSTETDSDESISASDRSSRIHIIHEKSWIIPNDFKIIDSEFFRFIGDKIDQIIRHQSVIDAGSVISTGITWSFPLEMVGHNRGRIVHVSKGYTIGEDVLNQDLKIILEKILLDNFNLQLDIKVIVNDSLAVYAAGAFIDKYIKLGLVLGTGINMCCSLNASDKLHPEKILPSQQKMLFNIELSLFGDKLIPDFTNKYDHIIDPRFATVDPSFQSFMSVEPKSNLILQPHELMTSGRYLPELTRLVLVDLIANKEIFTDLETQSLSPLSIPYDGFSGELMCFIDETDDLQEITHKLIKTYQWPLNSIRSHDVIYLKNIIANIIERAAIIVSIIILATIKLLKIHNPDLKLGKKLDIGFVGSVLYYFNNYRNLITSLINNDDEIKSSGLTVEFKLIENSSLIGAAIGAAYYS